MKSLGVRLVKVEDSEGQRLDNFLMGLLKGVPRSRVYQMVRRGEVRVNGSRAKPDTRLANGDELRVPPAFTSETRTPRSNSRFLDRLQASVVHWDGDLICLNKPFGVAVHGGSGVNSGVIEGLRMLDPKSKQLELAHRLDRDTSGVLLVARNRRTLLALHDAFRRGEVDKTYDVLVYGRWPAGEKRVRLPLARRDRPSRGRLVVVDEQGKQAETHFERIRTNSSASWLKASPKTGRTHQIRVHCSASGHAVLGDSRYAAREQLALSKTFRPVRLWLHARSLSFELAGRQVRFEASADEQFAKAFETMGTGIKEPQRLPRAGNWSA